MAVLTSLTISISIAISQIASLAIASGNGLVLKGGSEAVNTNNALMSIVSEALMAHRVQDAVQMVCGRMRRVA